MFKIRPHYRKLVILPALIACFSSQSTLAQKGAFNPDDATPRGIVTPTPLDKMIAIKAILGDKLNWKTVSKRYADYVTLNKYNDKKVSLPSLVGMRMSDGAVSIMAKDAETLKKVAGDVEHMAKKLGVEDGQLRRAQLVKSYANKNKWNRVFMELGFLQKDVMDIMAKEGNKDRRAILIAAGWIHGAEIVSSIVKDNYSDNASSLLREPLLVKQMIKDLEKLSPEKRKDVIVVKMLETLKQLAELVDVKLNAPISKENIEKMYKLTSQFRDFVLTTKR